MQKLNNTWHYNGISVNLSSLCEIDSTLNCFCCMSMKRR